MVPAQKRLPIPDQYLEGLDPEFRRLWDEHGVYTTRADEFPVSNYRANPSSLSFIYPTWPGMSKLRVWRFFWSDTAGRSGSF